METLATFLGIKNLARRQAWSDTPVIPAPRRLRQESLELRLMWVTYRDCILKQNYPPNIIKVDPFRVRTSLLFPTPSPLAVHPVLTTGRNDSWCFLF